MIDIAGLSARYDVRRLEDSDVDSIVALCRGNPQFYRFCGAEATREQVLRDMRVAPPGIGASDKYYIGFFEADALVAVMDLIDGYPAPDIVYIGFFMMDRAFQGRQLGTAIIRETADYLKSTGKRAIRLAIDRGNPQSTHFWKKNGFAIIKEVELDGWTKLVAERQL